VGRLVFAEPAARAKLEKIIHPRVRARAAQLVAEAPPGSVVVNDVPLLVETGIASTFDVVVVVEASPATRVARLVNGRGMSPTEARDRIAAQASDEQRRAVADVVLTNDGSLAELRTAVDRLWSELTAAGRERSRS